MNSLRTTIAILLGGLAFGELYMQAQVIVFQLGLISDDWLRNLASNPPFGSELFAVVVYGLVFFADFFLAAIAAAAVPGLLIGIFVSRRPVAHAAGAASLAVLGLFVTALFVVLRPRYIPAWFGYPLMAAIMVVAMTAWAYLGSHITKRFNQRSCRS